jgi:small multidrug resistance family-3 protein
VRTFSGAFALTLIFKSLGLFFITAFAELLGSYLMYLWLRQGKSSWLAIPASVSLTAFGWLLTLHPGAAARTYAAYGGVYVFSALLWLWWVEGQPPTRWDLLGVAVILVGASIIITNRP